MPSLSAPKMLITIAVTFQLPLAEPGKRTAYPKQKLLGFLDVKRAHFNSSATREIYLELPDEAKNPGQDVVGKLLRSLCGTRDAPLNWELTIRAIMMELGFKQGRSKPCIYFNAKRDLRVVVRGDDFTSTGTFEDIKWFHTELSKRWMVVKSGILGAVETLKESSDILSLEDATTYRAIAMRAAYLAQDRPDIQVATRLLAQGLQKPTANHMLMLKRLARYVRHRPRMAQVFPHQKTINPFVMWSDADHAGCVKTRKYVSGGVLMFVLMLGGCCVKTYSKGQGVVSLSSGESEYYALLSAASSSLGEVSASKDWGLSPDLEVNMDASAGIAMGSRRGLGKAKHVDTQYHWVQDRVAMRHFKLKKVCTNSMLADVLTKPVAEEKMNKAL
eukprot:s1954_g2.t1